MSTRSTTVTINSRLSEIARVAEHFKAFCGPRIPQEDCRQIELCLVEAVTNVIEHACRFNEGYQVAVCFEIDSDSLVIEIRDTGTPMVPGTLARETSNLEFDPADVGKLPEGGIGLEIMKHYLDSIDFLALDGTNVLRLTKHLEMAARHAV